MSCAPTSGSAAETCGTVNTLLGTVAVNVVAGGAAPGTTAATQTAVSAQVVWLAPTQTLSVVSTVATLLGTVNVNVVAGGGGTTQFQSLTWRIENNIEGVAKLDGRLRRDVRKRNDFRRIVISGNATFETFSEYDFFLSGSETQLYTTFKGKAITTSHFEMLQIDVPRFRYSEYPNNIGGPGLISIPFRARGMIDPTSNYCFEVTLTNSRVNPYTVNTTA